MLRLSVCLAKEVPLPEWPVAKLAPVSSRCSLPEGAADERPSGRATQCAPFGQERLVVTPDPISYEVNPGHDHSADPPKARDDSDPLDQVGVDPITALQFVADDDNTHRKCNTEDGETTHWLRIE